ncbi:MAG: hypothetical protein WBM78_10130 [Desulfobacterales bacterium]
MKPSASFIRIFDAAQTRLALPYPALCDVIADSLEGARAEAGDFIQAGVDWGRVRPLAEAIEDRRPEEGPVIFKSVGHAMFDLAAARLAFSGGGP